MQLKKLLSMFLSVALIASLLSITPAFAAEQTEIFEVGVAATSATSISTNPNLLGVDKEVTVTVKATQNTGVSGLDLKIKYDTNAFEYVANSLVDKNLFGNGQNIKVETGYIYLSLIAQSTNTSVGDICEFKLKTKADFCGSTEINVIPFFADVNGAGQTQVDSCCQRFEDGKYIPFASNGYNVTIHNFDINGKVTEPECEKGGYTTYTCLDCGTTVDADPTEAKKHTPKEAVRENYQPAKCTENGSYDMVVYCAECNEELERTNHIEQALSHKPAATVKENEKAPTCTENGSYDDVVYCSVCKEELSRNTVTVPATGHTYKFHEKQNEVAATCTNEGSYDIVSYCEVCKHEFKETVITVAKLPHTPSEAVKENEKAPTCTEKGSYDSVIYCEVCKGEISRETKEINVIEHTPVLAGNYSATCTKEGLENRTECSVCGTELSKGDVVAKLQHTEKSVLTKATIKKNGSYEYTCDVCGTQTKATKVICSAKTIKLSSSEVTYNGKKRSPKVIVKDSNGNKISSKNYTVKKYTKSPKNPGKYKIKVTLKGEYSGSKTMYFTILPKTTKFSKVTAGDNSVTLKWKTVKSQADGYKIEYSTNSKFKSKYTKSIVVKGKNKAIKTIKNLKNKKIYYVRISSYKGKKFYSNWSDKKAFKTK